MGHPEGHRDGVRGVRGSDKDRPEEGLLLCVDEGRHSGRQGRVQREAVRDVPEGPQGEVG